MPFADLVEKLAAADDPEAAMKLVADVLALLPAQTDPALLLASAFRVHAADEYVLASHLWARAREVAQTDEQRYDATSGLFFELQRVALETPEFAADVDERIVLAGEVLELLKALPASAGPTNRAYERSVVTGHRATLQLEAARRGRTDLLAGARRDLEEEIRWLTDGRDVPAHLHRRQLVANARIHLGEVLLLAGEADAAIEELESGIAALEAAGALAGAVARGYELLARAEHA